MGVTPAPTSANLIASSAAVDLFQFKKWIKGLWSSWIPGRNCSLWTW